jgi:glycosyltransferase involved in cell wall biosynthesis
MIAIFSPGPSFSDPVVRKAAGWVHILDLYKEGLEELGYTVVVPSVPPELIDGSSTVSKILSYDTYAAYQISEGADLFLGPPGYSMAQMMKLGKQTNKFLYVWNNADWWRDQQLAEEYKKHRAFYDLSPSWRWINKTALEMCDHVIACSPWVKMTHAKVVPEDKISIAFWGVDSQMFIPAEQEPPGFRVLFVGGDPIRKGLFYLFQAIAEIPDIELWIVGHDGWQNLPPQIRQFGQVPHSEMPNIYRQCHVQCVPTLEDGIALCIQEGMAAGVVPITSPETAEVFTDKVSGIKVNYRDIEGIRNAIVALKEDPRLRRSMAKNAREEAVQDTWEQTKEEFKDIILGKVELWDASD